MNTQNRRALARLAFTSCRKRSDRMTTSITAQAVANYAVDYCANVRKPSRPISNLQLQKMLFLIQCDYCSATNGDFLFDDDFEAWKYGPVVPSVYREFSIWGGLPITRTRVPHERLVQLFFGEQRTIVENTIEKWIDEEPWALVAQSHAKGSPWDRTYQGGVGLRQVISKQLIRDFVSSEYEN